MKTLTLLLLFIFITPVFAMTLQEGITDNTSITLEYTGTWASVAEPLAFGSAYESTTDSSSTLTFETYAQAFTIFYVLTPTGGDFELCVDATCQTVPTVGTTARATLELTGLGTGLKAVTIGKAVADASPISFDAVYIYPSYPDAEVTQEPHYIYEPFNFNGDAYTGVLELRITSGDMAIIVLLVSIWIVQIAQLFVRWLKLK